MLDPETPGSGDGSQGDEPTLETDRPADDDEPTLETDGQGTGGESTSETQPRTSSGWGSRLEQMTAAREERRRRIISRVWLTAVPVLVLLVIAMVLLAVYGGQGGSDGSTDTTVIVARTPVDGSALLLLENEEALSAAVLLQPWDSGGVVLAVPGATLLESQGAFSTLTEIHDANGADAVKSALSIALDLPLGPAAVATWEDVEAALSATGIETSPGDVDTANRLEGESLAQAVRGLVQVYVAGEDSSTWEGVTLQGDAEGFLRAVGLGAESMADNVWSAAALGGTAVDGDGYSYLEPDINAARDLLVVTVEETVVTVEIRDGAGIEGAAREAGDLLVEEGFVLAPMSYAEGYPGVETTQILVSAEERAEAEEVAIALGVGEIVEDGSMAALHILVVLGKDYEVETTSTTESTG